MRSATFRMYTWQQMAGFGQPAARRACRDLFSYRRPVRLCEFRMYTWRQMADFGLPAIRRARVEIYLVTDSLRAFANLGRILGGKWPISAYPPSAGRLEILYGYGLLLRPGEFRMYTWRQMADFGLPAIRRARRDCIWVRIAAAPW